MVRWVELDRLGEKGDGLVVLFGRKRLVSLIFERVYLQ